jgi:hypothetical protein
MSSPISQFYKNELLLALQIPEYQKFQTAKWQRLRQLDLLQLSRPPLTLHIMNQVKLSYPGIPSVQKTTLQWSKYSRDSFLRHNPLG